MKFPFYYVCVLLSYNLIVYAQEPRWSLLVYMEAPDLYEAAIKNITGLLQAHISENANVFLQLHLSGSTAFRYRVGKGALLFEESVTLSLQYEQDILDACAWAYAHRSKYQALILWGHGSGILLPMWHEEEHEWKVEHDASLDISRKSSLLLHKLEHHRAVFLNNITQDYLTNNNMVRVIKEVSESILRKKLDILGFDCCLGAMFEHAYQISDYVQYLVGCQNCELPDGFDYYALGKRISDSSYTPRSLVARIVQDYGMYYKQHAKKGLYTLAGFDCSKAKYIKDLLDAFMEVFIPLLNDAKITVIKELIRNRCIRFCWMPMYTDLYTFLTVIEEAIKEDAWAPINREIYNNLRILIKTLKAEIHYAVVYNITGHRMADAHGISIYLPYSHIDSSYYVTQFAQQSRWLEFLRLITDK